MYYPCCLFALFKSCYVLSWYHERHTTGKSADARRRRRRRADTKALPCYQVHKAACRSSERAAIHRFILPQGDCKRPAGKLDSRNRFCNDQQALIPEVQEPGREDTKAGAGYILKYFRLAMLSSSLAFSFSSAIDVYLWLYERYEVPSYAIAIMSMAFAIITAILMKYEDISPLPT